MEAIIYRRTAPHLAPAAIQWVKATRRPLRALLNTAGSALVNYSRAALLLKGGPRQSRRL
jgi:hypothetical protein